MMMMMIVPIVQQLNEIVTNDRARFAIISIVRGRLDWATRVLVSSSNRQAIDAGGELRSRNLISIRFISRLLLLSILWDIRGEKNRDRLSQARRSLLSIRAPEPQTTYQLAQFAIYEGSWKKNREREREKEKIIKTGKATLDKF